MRNEHIYKEVNVPKLLSHVHAVRHSAIVNSALSSMNGQQVRYSNAQSAASNGLDLAALVVLQEFLRNKHNRMNETGNLNKKRTKRYLHLLAVLRGTLRTVSRVLQEL